MSFNNSRPNLEEERKYRIESPAGIFTGFLQSYNKNTGICILKEGEQDGVPFLGEKKVILTDRCTVEPVVKDVDGVARVIPRVSNHGPRVMKIHSDPAHLSKLQSINEEELSLSSLRKDEPFDSKKHKFTRATWEEVFEDLTIHKQQHRYFLVTTMEQFTNMYELIEHDDCRVIGFSIKSAKQTRSGKLCWFQISTKRCVYLIDFLAVGDECLGVMKQLLEESTITKVVHNSRHMADILFHKYGIILDKNSIFDTQVAPLIIQRQREGEMYRYVQPLSDLLVEYLKFDKADVVAKRTRSCNEDDERLWEYRPVTEPMLQALTLDVVYLPELQRCLQRELCRDFVDCIDFYLTAIRDADDKTAKLEEDNLHCVPENLAEWYKAKVDLQHERRRRNRRKQRDKYQMFMEVKDVNCDPDIVISGSGPHHKKRDRRGGTYGTTGNMNHRSYTQAVQYKTSKNEPHLSLEQREKRFLETIFPVDQRSQNFVTKTFHHSKVDGSITEVIDEPAQSAAGTCSLQPSTKTTSDGSSVSSSCSTASAASLPDSSTPVQAPHNNTPEQASDSDISVKSPCDNAPVQAHCGEISMQSSTCITPMQSSYSVEVPSTEAPDESPHAAAVASPQHQCANTLELSTHSTNLESSSSCQATQNVCMRDRSTSPLTSSGQADPNNQKRSVGRGRALLLL